MRRPLVFVFVCLVGTLAEPFMPHAQAQTLDPAVYPTQKPAAFSLRRLTTHEEGEGQSRCSLASRELTLASVPLIGAGFALRPFKQDFRDARYRFVPTYRHTWDDYLQYVPLAASWGMKVGGVEGRSDWPRFLVANACSYAVMAALSNGLKYSIRDPRPDAETRNSFPSGHTALAFTAATILHKEYGLTRSPWYSVAGYTTATATAVGRVLNNRHWAADVVCGAGIGILSTELGYFLTDLILGDGHYVRPQRPEPWNPNPHPSFITFQMGATWVPDIGDIHTAVASMVGLEAAYFFTPYVGVGGRLRVSSAQATLAADIDRLALFSWDAGIYGAYPIDRHWSAGAKVTYGRLHTSYISFASLYVPATASGKLGLGASITYQARGGVAWRLFADYDHAHAPYHLFTLGTAAELRF